MEIDWPSGNCPDIENSKIGQSFLNCYLTNDDSEMSNFQPTTPKTPKTPISKNDQISFVYGSRIKTFRFKCYKAYRLWRSKIVGEKIIWLPIRMLAWE